MLLVSATDIAIALAHKAGTLKVEDRNGRFGPFVAISDNNGLIEVADTRDEADARISAIMARK